MLAICLAVLLVAGVGVGVWRFWPGSGEGAATEEEVATTREVLKRGAELTEADLEKLEASVVVDELMRTYMARPVLHLRNERTGVMGSTGYREGEDYNRTIIHGGFDYRSHKLNFEQVDHRANDPEPGSHNRCMGRTGYLWLGNLGWGDPDTCTALDPAQGVNGVDDAVLSNTVSNGILPAGMTEDQIDVFLSTITEEYDEYLQPGKLGLTKRGSRSYLRVPITFAAQEIDGGTYGTQLLIFAFRDTGLDANEHPYVPAGTGAASTDAVFYVDPTTMLPAYSEVVTHEPGDSELAEATIYRTEYLWDEKLPTFDMKQKDQVLPPEVTWPREPAGTLGPS